MPTSILTGVATSVSSILELKWRTAKSIYFATDDWIFFLLIVALTKYLTLPANPLNVSYSFSKLGNLKLNDLFYVKNPAGSSSFASEWNYVDKFLSL